jgi:thiazole synthase ThiGH ThiG subunit
MAEAFKIAVQAGEMARQAGAADTTASARASSPLTGFLDRDRTEG